MSFTNCSVLINFNGNTVEMIKSTLETQSKETVKNTTALTLHFLTVSDTASTSVSTPLPL